jgi:hypothetical protein
MLLGVSGCTICPDPFDYSGPVPNGSAPQNDFRARSNGIAPTGGVPRPWPPVVRVAPPQSDEPRDVTTAGEADTNERATDPEGVILPAAAEARDGRDGVTDPEATVADASVVDDILPTAAPSLPERGPPSSETPGWRPRD